MIKALVFDLDGTLADTDPLHFQAFAEALARYGIVLDHEMFRTRISGQSNRMIGEGLLPGRSDAERAAFADAKEAAFRALVESMAPTPGLVELLAFAEERGMALSLVTNAPRANVDHMLRVLELERRFSVVVLGDDLPRQKPDPLPYVTALERLGVRPDQALAFEDSVPGVRSAAGSGMVTFGLTTSQPASDLAAAGARHTIADFRDAALWDLLRRG